MKLKATCTSCRTDINILSYANTRPELAAEMGNDFSVTCSSCAHRHKIHVNDVRAVENKVLLLVSVVIGLLVMVILWFFFGAIGTISIALPIIIWQQHRKSVHGFNAYKPAR